MLPDPCLFTIRHYLTNSVQLQLVKGPEDYARAYINATYQNKAIDTESVKLPLNNSMAWNDMSLSIRPTNISQGANTQVKQYTINHNIVAQNNKV